MKTFCLIVSFFFTFQGISQQVDSILDQSDTLLRPFYKPEILSEGSIDIVQTGQMNAAARIFRLFIGEPRKFHLPISLYAGVSANSLSAIRQYEEFVPNLINPGTGTLNIYFDGDNKLSKDKSALTSVHFQYQSGFRMLNAYSQTQLKNMQLFNFIFTAGLSFMTGAWERNKMNNLGIFWISLRCIYSKTPGALVQELVAQNIQTGMLGYSMGIGIEISQALNMKIYYFRFITNNSITPFHIPYIQLSFKYSMK
ncbi:MAG TPA: hypothetical protein VLJ68_08455 [Chitinophagaceae bacterium]|nr:hypothetical protein [Chitinophagaceae bacterium]